MSMICVLRQAEESEIKNLLANPDQISEFLFGDEDEEIEERPKGEIDLDKAWHGLHCLFTGSGEEGDVPLCYLLTDGEVIGDEDVGYGPARALLPSEIAAFNTALSEITADDLRKRFNPKAMMKQDIYPTIWDRDPKEDDALGYLLEYYDILTGFVRETTNANKGLIVFLS